MEGSKRLVAGIEGTALLPPEIERFCKAPPFGFLLLKKNIESASQVRQLIEELHSFGTPRPLVFVDQEGGPVDRIGPLLGQRFPSPASVAGKGSDRVHENAYLMGRAARILGFDASFAPVVDLAQPGTGAVILGERCFGFHAEDAVLAGMMFVNGLARAGIASCLKHFPGLGRGAVDAHQALPVVDAHDVDLMVTDVMPFTRLARSADAVMVGHASYPLLSGEDLPASQSRAIYRILREKCRFPGLVFSDDLNMGALLGTLPERALRVAAAGSDVVVVTRPGDLYLDIADAAGRYEEPGLSERMERFRDRCPSSPVAFSEAAWTGLANELEAFNRELARPARTQETRGEIGDG